MTLRHDQHGSTTETTANSARGFSKRAARRSPRAGSGGSPNAIAARCSGTARRAHRRCTRGSRATTCAGSTRAACARRSRRRKRELADPQDFRLELAARRQLDRDARRGARLRAGAAFRASARAPSRRHRHSPNGSACPPHWARAANTLDRLIVPDAFQAEAFRAAGVTHADRDRAARRRSRLLPSARAGAAPSAADISCFSRSPKSSRATRRMCSSMRSVRTFARRRAGRAARAAESAPTTMR